MLQNSSFKPECQGSRRWGMLCFLFLTHANTSSSTETNSSRATVLFAEDVGVGSVVSTETLSVAPKFSGTKSLPSSPLQEAAYLAANPPPFFKLRFPSAKPNRADPSWVDTRCGQEFLAKTGTGRVLLPHPYTTHLKGDLFGS